MTKPPDLEDLARRYVELWQDQIAAATADPELTEAMVRMMQLMGGGLTASTAVWRNLWASAAASSAAPIDGFGTGRPYGDDGSTRYPNFWVAPPAGPSSFTDPSSVGRVDLAQLDARLAALEKRLAALEAGTSPTRRGARGRTRRNGTP